MTLSQVVLKTQVVFLLSITAFILVSSLARPMSSDHGVFAWAANATFHGKVLYKDVWEQKGPVTFLVFAIPQVLFGNSFWGIRVLEVVFIVITMIAIYRLMRDHVDFHLALASALLVSFAYLGQRYWDTAQADSFAALTLIWALCLLGRKSSPPRATVLLAGLLVAMTAGFKWLYIANALPLFILLQMMHSDDVHSKRVFSVWFITGIATGLVLIHGYLALTGGLYQYFVIQFDFNRLVHMGRNTSTFNTFLYTTILMIYGNGLWWFAFLIIPASEQKQKESRFVLWIGCWLLTLSSLVIVFIQNKPYIYQRFAPILLLPLIAILGISRIQEIYVQSKGNTEPARTKFAIWLFALVLSIPFFWEMSGVNGTYVAGWKYLCGILNREEFLALDIHEKKLLQQLKVAHYIQQHTTENDTVQVWGYDAILNYIANRQSPTRFGFNYPLVSSEGTPYQEYYRREFIESLTKNPPTYIVIVDNDSSGEMLKRTSTEELHRFAAFESYLLKHYRFETKLYDYSLWRQRP